MSGILAIQATAPARISADLVAALPSAGTLTLSAHDQSNGSAVIGTMVLSCPGVYADIHAAGDWAWYVNGTMTIAKVPTMSLQQNILAALQRPELLLGAREEFVLTGWYYRQ